jgi:phosphate transport system substrate-binding protein
MKFTGLLLISAMFPLFAQADVLKINGSTTVNLPVAEAAEILRAKQSMQIQVDTQGGSSGGISSLGDGLVEIAMSSKPLTEEDRTKYPNTKFHPVQIGADAVALVVSRDVADGGVRAVTKEQAQQIYEGKLTNWKQIGGPDRRIVFFNKEPGRGTWEVFAHWLYGSAKNAPSVSLPEVGGNEEARNKVASTRGAISQLSASWADGKKVVTLGIQTEDGIILPLSAEIAAGRYPMSRPLFLITNGEPAGDAKTFVEFMLSPEGQALVKKHGYLGIADLKP